MEKKYFRISRYWDSELLGTYIQPIDQIMNAMDGEFDAAEDFDIGDKLEIEIVVMEEEEYNKLPEFAGY